MADDFLDVNTTASEIVFKLEDLIREAQKDGAAKYKKLYEDLVARYAALHPEGE